MAFPTPAQAAVLRRILEGGPSALIVSGPGTGKSRLGLGLARRRVAALGKESPRQILFLSFSNSTIRRLAADAGLHFTKRERQRLRFTTFHAFAADLLVRYGRFVDLTRTVKVIDKLEEKLISLEYVIDESAPNYHKEMECLARRSGFLSFDVLVPIAVKLLKKSPRLRGILNRSFPLVIVDEFQDTSQPQWELLKLLGDGTQVIALADPNQIIYASMHAATEGRLREFAKWKGIQATHLPAEHHRCSNARILGFADCLLHGSPYTQGFVDSLREVQLEHRNQLRAHLALLWREIRSQVGRTGSIAILVPSNKLAEEVTTSLRNPPAGSGIPFRVYARIARDEAAYDSVRVALAALHDHAFILKERSRNRLALALCALNGMWSPRSKIGADLLRRVGRHLETSERDPHSDLSVLIRKLRGPETENIEVRDLLAVLSGLRFHATLRRIEAHYELQRESVPITPEQPSLFERSRSERPPRGLYGNEAREGRTQILTYHKAKGREFDCVLMVVDPRHESAKPAIEESRRLYYVCATRPKRWLCIIHYRGEPGRVLRPVL